MPEILQGTLLPDTEAIIGTLLPPDQQPLQSLTSGRGESLKLDMENEAPAYARLLGSMKMTKEGLFGFLESVAGKGNVFQDSTGELYLRDPQNPKNVVPYNKAGFTLRDLAGLAGTAVEAGPGIALGAAGGVAGAAAGGAAGAALKQGISSLLPGDDKASMLERGADIAVGAATAGVGQAIGGAASFVGGRVWDALRGQPLKFLGPRFQEAAKAPYAQEGLRLEKSTGIPLSAGEITGNRQIKMAEGVVRRAITSADIAFEFEQKQLQAALGRLDSTLNVVGPKSGAITLGTKVNEAFSEAWDAASKIRQSQAQQDFGTVRSLSQGTPLIPTQNIVDAVNERIRTLQVPGLHGDAQARVAMMERWRDSIPAVYTAEQFEQVLSAWSKASKGVGDVVKDMDKASQRELAVTILNAAERDLDKAVSFGGRDAATATALRAARDNYKANSETMRELGRSVLATITKQGAATPERAVETISTLKYPTEIKQAMSVLDQFDPASAQMVRRNVVETAIANATPAVSTQVASGVKFSAAKFVSNLPDQDVLAAYGFSARSASEIKDVALALERVAQKEFTGSPTAPLALAWNIMTGVFTLNPLVLGSLGGQVLLPRALAKATLTPEGRNALATVAQPGFKPGRQGLSAVLYLTGLNAAETVQENARDFQAPAEQQLQETR